MLPSVFTWLLLPNLPKVPEHFINLAHKLGHPKEDPSSDSLITDGTIDMEYKTRIVTKNGKSQVTRCQERIDMGQEWNKWVRENIINDFIETSLRINTGPEQSTLHGPHIDGEFYRIYYLIDRGGDPETVFYHHPKHPVLFGKGLERGRVWSNIDDLIEIERVKFPIGQWLIFNGIILHGIENVTGPRLNFNISVLPKHFNFSINNKLKV